MNLELDGRHVVVTGGSKGIGLACAQAFLAEGASVTIVSRRREHLDAALRPLQQQAPSPDRVRAVAIDLSDTDAGTAMADQAQAGLGPIDVLVNSAGAARRTVPDELTPQAWHDAMTAKYFTYIHAIDAVIKRMAARGRGVVVNVIGAGGKMASPIHLPGGSANAALMLATAGLANAYGERGVRVVGVNPGSTLTERLKHGMQTDAQLHGISYDEALQRATARTALKRIATPQEIADVVVFLASARASYVTGVNLTMDGGSTPTVL
ncbi:MAG: SDR family oxidoreductase [Burkholderiaceae bacterium]